MPLHSYIWKDLPRENKISTIFSAYIIFSSILAFCFFSMFLTFKFAVKNENLLAILYVLSNFLTMGSSIILYDGCYLNKKEKIRLGYTLGLICGAF